MKTVGTLFKQSRKTQKVSLVKLEEKTKIKKGFIKSIEKGKWDDLPEYPVVAGFVKRIASYLGIDERRAVALLRRDYPMQKISVDPKKEIVETFKWSPRLTFLVGILAVAALIIGYLTIQYIQFNKPPILEVHDPIEGQEVTERLLRVVGETDPDATIRINNQPVLIDEEGRFDTEIEVFEGTEMIEVKAVSRSGKESVIHRNIVPKL